MKLNFDSLRVISLACLFAVNPTAIFSAPLTGNEKSVDTTLPATNPCQKSHFLLSDFSLVQHTNQHMIFESTWEAKEQYWTVNGIIVGQGNHLQLSPPEGTPMEIMLIARDGNCLESSKMTISPR